MTKPCGVAGPPGPALLRRRGWNAASRLRTWAGTGLIAKEGACEPLLPPMAAPSISSTHAGVAGCFVQPEGGGRYPTSIRCRRLPVALGLAIALVLLGGCGRRPSPEAQRIEELNLKIQQLEQRLNSLAREKSDGADRKGKPPAGVIKSLTIRTGSQDDRLRIYWADGTTTDLPCTKEQSTFACG